MYYIKISKNSDGFSCTCTLPSGEQITGGPAGRPDDAFLPCVTELRADHKDGAIEIDASEDAWGIDPFEKMAGGYYVSSRWASSIDVCLHYYHGIKIPRFYQIHHDYCEYPPGYPSHPIGPSPELVGLLDQYTPKKWTYYTYMVFDIYRTATGTRPDKMNLIPTMTFERDEDVALAMIALPTGSLLSPAVP